MGGGGHIFTLFTIDQTWLDFYFNFATVFFFSATEVLIGSYYAFYLCTFVFNANLKQRPLPEAADRKCHNNRDAQTGMHCATR